MKNDFEKIQDYKNLTNYILFYCNQITYKNHNMYCELTHNKRCVPSITCVNSNTFDDKKFKLFYNKVINNQRLNKMNNLMKNDNTDKSKTII